MIASAMSALRVLLQVVFALSLPLFLTATTLRAEISTVALYDWSISQFGVSNTTGIPRAELEQANRRLVDYFDGRVDSGQMTVTKNGRPVDLFNERELIHLRDVRDLIQLDYRVQAITSALLVACSVGLLLLPARPRAALGAALLWGGGLTLALALSLAVGSVTGFGRLFTIFHEVSFNNPFWLLDPARDHLIMMFPEPFWSAAVFLALGAIILEAVGLIAIGRYLGRGNSKRDAAETRHSSPC